MGPMWNLWYSYLGCRFASVLGVTATVLKPCQRRCLRALGAQDPLDIGNHHLLAVSQEGMTERAKMEAELKARHHWDCHNIGVKDVSVGPPYPLNLMEYHAITIT